jgi:hypothetical protein
MTGGTGGNWTGGNWTYLNNTQQDIQNITTPNNVTISTNITNTDWLKYYYRTDPMTKGIVFNYNKTPVSAETIKGLQMIGNITAETGGIYIGNVYNPIFQELSFQNNGGIFYLINEFSNKINVTFADSITPTLLSLLNLFTNKIQDNNFRLVAQGNGNNQNGLMYVESNCNTTGGNSCRAIALRSAGIVQSTSNTQSAIGYQGYAMNKDTAQTGNAIAMNPMIANTGTLKRASFIEPTKVSVTTPSSHLFTVWTASSGDIVAYQNNVIALKTSYSAGNLKDGLWKMSNINTSNGFGYFESGVITNGSYVTREGYSLNDTQGLNISIELSNCTIRFKGGILTSTTC